METKTKSKKTHRRGTLNPHKRRIFNKGEEHVQAGIVWSVHLKRSKKALMKDMKTTAKKVGTKDNPVDMVDWIRSPDKSDLEGIDTKRKRENSGWYEAPDQTGKAPKHKAASDKKKVKGVLREPIQKKKGVISERK